MQSPGKSSGKGGSGVHGERAQPVDMVRRGKTPSGVGDDPVAYGTGVRGGCQGSQDQTAARAPVFPGLKNYDYVTGRWRWEEKREKEIQKQISIIQKKESRQSSMFFNQDQVQDEKKINQETRREVASGSQSSPGIEERSTHSASQRRNFRRKKNKEIGRDNHEGEDD